MQNKNTSLKHPSGNQYRIVLVLVACFFSLTGCYENSDGTTTEPTETEFPKVTNDGFLIGSVVENGELVEDYTLELNAQDYTVEKQFYLELERVNKLFQPISVYKGNDLIAFAVTPILQDEVNLVEIETFTQSEVHVVNQSGVSVEISESLELSIDGSDPANENLGEINVHILNGYIGYSGNENNVKRFALNHLDAFILDGGDQSLNSVLEYSDYSLSVNIGLFKFDDVTSDWSLITEIDATQGILTLDTDGKYSIAEYIPAVIVEGELTHDGKQLGFAQIEIANGSLTSPYRHYSTGSGKYIAFIEKESDVEIALSECNNLSKELITAQDVDRSDVTLDYGDFSGNLYSIKAEVVGCSATQGSHSQAQLIGLNNESFILPNNKEVSIAACDTDAYRLAIELEDGSDWSLPWSADLNDPYLFLPNCMGVSDGYGYLKINGENKYYETFVREITMNDQIVLTTPGGEFQVRLRESKIGFYQTEEVGLVVNDIEFGTAGYAVDCGTSQLGCGIDYCQVTHLDSDWLRVSFAGEVWMQTLQTLNAGNYAVEGNIVIKL